MANFETLNILFTADASQLKKEVDDVQKKTKETGETFTEVEKQTKKTDNGFVDLAKSLAKVAAAYFTVGSIVGGFRSSLAHTTELSNLSRDLGINIEALDAWGKAVKNFGGDANAFYADVESFAKRTNSTGEVAIKFLTQRLAEVIKLQGLAGAQRYGQEQLGLSASTISFLLQGQKAIEAQFARQKELGPVTAADAKINRDFNKATGELADALDKLYRILAEGILPKLTDLTKFVTGGVEKINAGTVSPTSFASFVNPLSYIVPEFLKKEENNQNVKNNSLKDFIPDFLKIPSFNGQVTNSQSRNTTFGDIHINSNASDTKGVAKDVLAQLDLREQLAQLNSYVDNAVVI